MRPSVKKVSSILSTIYFVVLLVLRLLEQHMWVWLGIALPIIVSSFSSSYRFNDYRHPALPYLRYRIRLWL